ncbi:MAG: hypothetical protein ACOH2J_22065 [Allorhizobium sp.]
MRIIDVRPASRPADLAIFDVEIGPHLRLFNIALRRTPDGRHRILAPNAWGKHSASFHPELAEQITQAAVAALGGSVANAENSTKAA